MNKFWERYFYFFTIATQGSSSLNPRAYAILHRMHHAYSDTDKDPHSPHFFKDVFRMMMHTKSIYFSFASNKVEPEKPFKGDYPVWPWLDKVSDSWITRIAFGALYVLFYMNFATAWWQYLLLPIHFLMGPIHGAIVNWCGHKYGYSNYNNKDKSKNTLPWDFLMMGELFQNNHHKNPNNIKLANKWFEFDPTYPLIVLLSWVKVIKIRKV